MAQAGIDDKAMLVKLSDSDLQFAEGAQDIRGRKVLDRNGQELGKVNDLFVDQQEQKVRFLEISSGGFLGLGDTKFLIPVDAVAGITDDEVRVDQAGERIAGAPRYSPELVDARYVTDVYEYYGYTPYWGPGYNYPSYPYYPPMP